MRSRAFLDHCQKKLLTICDTVEKNLPGRYWSAAVRETLVALARDALAGPDRDVLFERNASGTWLAQSNTALLARSEAVALGLRARGLVAGDRVALMSPNRADWIVANLGISFAGCVTVPIYATQALDQVAFIIADSGARALIVDTTDVSDRLHEAGVALDAIVFDGAAASPTAFSTLTEIGAARRTAAPAELGEIAAQIAPDDLAILIYTSGTTGQPKGVMLSHRNVFSNATTAQSLIADVILPGEPVLSILPLAHIYENTNVFVYLIGRSAVYVNRNVEQLLDDLRSVRPVMMFCVPRIFERTYAGIRAKARAAGGMKARLVPWALAVGLRYKRAQLNGAAIHPVLRAQFAVAHAIVLSKLRAQLGCDRLKFFASGSASLHIDLALTFAAADIVILEGYGLSECSPVVTANGPHHPRIGTVGRAIPGVELRVADDGELLVRGPNVMQGYYGKPAETAEVLHDGWLATGDVAVIEADGFVRIVDRKKEIFKTTGGKYISPVRVESAIARSPFVVQVVVIGSGKAHPAALVSPNWPAVREALHLPAGTSSEELARRDDVRDFIALQCRKQTVDLADFEQIRWAGVLPRDLTIDRDELTPTLKIKRRVVEAKFASLIPQY